MPTFQGAGAGQAVEVRFCIIFSLVYRNIRYSLGCVSLGFPALKRARNQDYGSPSTWDLLAYPPTPCNRSRKTLAPKWGTLFVPYTRRVRSPPPDHILCAPTGDREADTRQF